MMSAETTLLHSDAAHRGNERVDEFSRFGAREPLCAITKCSSKPTYRFVGNNPDGERAADGQLTGPGHGPPLNTLEHAQLLDRVPTTGLKHEEEKENINKMMTPAHDPPGFKASEMDHRFKSQNLTEKEN